jgi:hypothetical protein
VLSLFYIIKTSISVKINLSITIVFALFSFLEVFSQQNTYSLPIIEKTNKIGFIKKIEYPTKSDTLLYDRTKSYLTNIHIDNSFYIDELYTKLADKGSFPADFHVGSIPMTYTILYSVTVRFQT